MWCGRHRTRAGILAALFTLPPPCAAGLSGHVDMLVAQDDRGYETRNRLEQWLDLLYEQPELGLRQGTSLGLRQADDGNRAEIYQLYLEQAFGGKRNRLRLGRFQQTDALGFYSLDGARLNLESGTMALALYGGIPHRMEDLYSIDADSLYGADLFLREYRWHGMRLDGRIGWQWLEQDAHHTGRLNLGLGGHWQAQPRTADAPARETLTLSMAGTYLTDEAQWENFQLKALAAPVAKLRLRLDYESYRPGREAPGFRDRFYHLYGRQRQTRFMAGCRLFTAHNRSWSLQGRHVDREDGDSGYGGALGWWWQDTRGLAVEARLDHLALDRDAATSLYVEAARPLTARLRAVLGSVWQQQEQARGADNRALGLEAQLERMVRSTLFPNGLLLALRTSYIRNSRQQDEYGLSLRLSYSFTAAAPGGLQ